MRVKHAGQMPLPTRPKLGAGEYHAFEAKRAVCNCAKGLIPTVVYVTPVPVTTRRRRRIASPVSV